MDIDTPVLSHFIKMENIMKNKSKMQVEIARKRNIFHNHPLLGKGCVHTKSNKSKRIQDKLKIKKEWLPQNILSPVHFEEVFLIKIFTN